MARTNTEVVSNLPEFVAIRSKDFKAWALVTCPRDSCGETFLVKMSAWYKQRSYGAKNTVIVGRSCPYCFRASRLPDRAGIR
jgi:hypothetical protein